MLSLDPISPVPILPIVAPDPQCAWCWPLLHPGQAYPEQWSSTICETHSARMLAQHTRLRTSRTVAKEARN